MPQAPPTIDFDDGDLLEGVGNYSPSSSWSKREVSEPLVYQVNWDYIGPATAFFLGVEWQGTDYQLYRTLPMRHPRWSYLYATRIADIRNIKVAAKHPGGGSLGLGGFYGPHQEYHRADLHVEFSQPPVRFLPNGLTAQGGTGGDFLIWTQSLNPVPRTITFHREWMRWCTYNYKPYADFIAIEGQLLHFAEGAAGNPQAVPVPQASIGFPISKGVLEVMWHQVPREYIFMPPPEGVGSSDPFLFGPGVPENLLAITNRVNEYEFLGYPAGTLLADPAEITEYVSPVQFGTVPQKLCDVRMTFRHFDPVKGEPASVYRGHQLMPWRDGRWYLATRTPYSGSGAGSPANPKVFKTIPFAYAFLPPVDIYRSPVFTHGA